MSVKSSKKHAPIAKRGGITTPFLSIASLIAMSALRRSPRTAKAIETGVKSTRRTPPTKNGKRDDHQKPNLKRPHEQAGGDEATNSDSSPAAATKVAKTDSDHDMHLADNKWKKWSTYASSSPFPDLGRPTPKECHDAFRILNELHREAVDNELSDANTPETIPHVLDAMIIAILSQATGWENAKRAMNSMKETYGSIYAYDDIMDGGRETLQEALKCGGLHMRKSMIITTILGQVKERYGKWDLDHLFQASDEDAMKELISYKYMGPKSASVVMGWCLKRNRFIVDVHIYRISGLWGWRPKKATRELTQSHLDAVVPSELKFMMHFLLIQHGRECPACVGGAKQGRVCEVRKRMKEKP